LEGIYSLTLSVIRMSHLWIAAHYSPSFVTFAEFLNLCSSFSSF
jgi:hypothetical protein